MSPFFTALEQADKTATLAINSLHCAVTDVVWQCFSAKELWFPLYIAVVVWLFAKLGWKKGIFITIACVLTVVACDQFANFTKAFFERFRPCWDDYMLQNGLHLLEDKGNMYGFYSAHAANAMGFAVCSSMCIRYALRLKSYNVSMVYSAAPTYLEKQNGGTGKVYATLICIWAVLVGLSRVFVGKHFLGDVIVGFAVGLVAGALLALLARLLMRITER